MSESWPVVATSATNSMELAPDTLGAPGTHGALLITPSFDGKVIKADSERDFICTAQLIQTSSPKRRIQGDFTSSDGSSFLSPPPGMNTLTVNTSSGSFVINSNDSNELSIITMTLPARDIQQALNVFQTAITPFLDHLAYYANVPVRTGTFKIHDKETEQQYITFISPFQQIIVDNRIDTITADLFPVYALYREARNSESPYYRLLCYFKILDGLKGMRGRLLKQARKRGVELKPKDDVLPSHADLGPDFSQYVGKTVKQLQDAILTKRYRDAVAHFELRDTSVLQLSSPADFKRFDEAAFAAELCVRVVIANYEHLTRTAAAAHQEKTE